ncbi:bifunctional adenosylcobinamide kinase/adenosylcobinamide-phosphate guanylyltransferase [Aquabacterium sp.]|uniref:bifunctional adenosylcobinamide kinase/adenosylcobinamide-phosphate guanylyltransferase n=1 Tax=Aquabacterium sp. TaxID=1872578 RepID=UPI0024879015|nr:bifunctional adenosylcobinamide kinase/adenosylcobinamide-phosphate guanylyltransferase [Aquabacterium sp.]MDI1258374.1 bifunctional adenosylcobinamide kinase/adenosylcobinamide-phosphate guanylyltransferase [Aquabacterium sp.]
MPEHHLIVGGQRSGKSRQAERLAQAWLRQSEAHSVTVVATALAFDDEMRERIQRHQQERPVGMATAEAPLRLAETLRAQALPGRLLLVDCLTLWLTNWLMPAEGQADLTAWRAERGALLAVLPHLPSPVVFVSNEVGWGIVPMSREVRAFVDELGWLNQAVAQRCGQVTLMVAGQAWTRPVTPHGE